MRTPPYAQLVPVMIPPNVLAGVTFHDTGGTNGWLAESLPAWVPSFVASLPLRGTVTQTVVRLLPAGQGIPPHVDPVVSRSPRVREHRYHVPLVTHPDVTMRWPEDEVSVHLEVGWLYEVQHQERVHEVVHQASIGRIHLCIDTAEILPEA